MSTPSKFLVQLGSRFIRQSSTATTSTPPLIARIRLDLKEAMKAKDSIRLNVLRAIISETNNASKTSFPIRTDLQLLSLIRKRVAAARDASRQFLEANRPDLTEKEDAQIVILQEYASHVKTMSAKDIQVATSQAISQLKNEGKKADLGSVLKSLFSPGGVLDGKPAERAEVAKIAKGAIEAEN